MSCRACLIVDEKELFDWNIEEYSPGLNYAECFQECTHLELSLELPQMLCYDCAFELRIAYSFIKRARRADQKLRTCAPYKHERTTSKSTYVNTAEDQCKVPLHVAEEKSPTFETQFYDEEKVERSTEPTQQKRQKRNIWGKSCMEDHLNRSPGQQPDIRDNCTDVSKYPMYRRVASERLHYKNRQVEAKEIAFEIGQNVEEITQHNDGTVEDYNDAMQCSDAENHNDRDNDEAIHDDDGSFLGTEKRGHNNIETIVYDDETTKNNIQTTKLYDEIIIETYEESLDNHDTMLNDEVNRLATIDAIQYNNADIRAVKNGEATHVEICAEEYWQVEPADIESTFNGSQSLIETEKEEIADCATQVDQPVAKDGGNEKITRAKSLQRLKCIVCIKSLDSNNSLRDHLKNAHIGQKLSCPQCLFSFRTDAQLRCHQKTHDGPACVGNNGVELLEPETDKPHLENVATPDVDSKTDMQRVHAKPKWLCEICSLPFKNISSLYRHKATHNRTAKSQHVKEAKTEQPTQDIYHCKICNKTYPSKLSLHSHTTKVHAERTWLCDVCSFTFKTESNLRRHQTTHENRERKYVCSVCGTKCLSQRILKNHMAIHDKNRKPKYACDECDKTFYVKSGLVFHKRFHAGETVACEVCNRPFARPCDLKVHMRIHTDEKPYKCAQCEASFKIISAYNVHLMMHKGYTQKCEHCDKVFTNASSLQKHKAKHNGETAKCSICSKGFYAKSKLRRHILNVHKVATAAEANELMVDTRVTKSFTPRIRRVLEDV